MNRAVRAAPTLAATAVTTAGLCLCGVEFLPSLCVGLTAACFVVVRAVLRRARTHAAHLRDVVRDLEVGTGIAVRPGPPAEGVGDLVERLRRVAQRHSTRVYVLEGQVIALEQRHDETLATVRARSAFMANLSHEIRTPLNGLLGFLAMLTDTELDEQQREWATVARESGEALMALLNDVLDLAKIEAGKLMLERVEFERDDLFENVTALFAPAAHARGVELLLDLDPQLPPRLLGDPMRLRQVIANLVSNAVKFTDEGSIELSARVAERAGTRIVLEIAVRDSGVGIPPDRLDRLFHAFEQAEDSTARRFGGTGLGLAIVKRIIEQMNGEVMVESEVGRGTRFVVRVPISVASSAAPPAELRPGLILLIDGHDRRRELLTRQLRCDFLEVTSVSDGAAAHAVLRHLADRQEPLVVLVDDAVRIDAPTLAAIRGRFDARLLVLRPPSAAYDAVEDGVDGVLIRPLRRAALTAAIVGAGRAETTRRRLPRTWSGRSILLVEDNVVNQRLMCAMLARLDVHVLLAANGSEAITAFERYGCDLVLMDVQMPVMDGIAATRAIRALGGEGARVPILALTANAQNGDREECLGAGMNDYLTKPVRAAALREAMARWLPDGVATQAGAGAASP
ncbi:MAG: ATP-binding protein [Planctomycetota bacterium]